MFCAVCGEQDVTWWYREAESGMLPEGAVTGYFCDAHMVEVYAQMRDDPDMFSDFEWGIFELDT